MDPLTFEQLVAELFKCRRFDVMTTSPSGDGGVDVFAVDPGPLTGGKIVIQVKSYRNTVSPGCRARTVRHRDCIGGREGHLGHDSGFGPDSHRFAEDLPLELINGEELVQLLSASKWASWDGSSRGFRPIG